MVRLREWEFADIVKYMRETYGINLEKKQILIECRMSGELERLGFTSFGAYFDKMRRDESGRMAEELVVRLTTNYTYLMREPEHFTLLREKIFRRYFKKAVHEYLVCRMLNRRGMLYIGNAASGVPEQGM